MVKREKHIVILTGAGISAESGIKTFRDSNGLWENHAIEDVASPEGFQRNPKMVHRFYNARRAQVLDHNNIAPNPGHFALSLLQERHKGQVTLITQNVDDLHERAGSKEVLHMHGSLLKMRCNECLRSQIALASFDEQTPCPICKKKSSLRPDIVWFGEMPLHLDRAGKELSSCDLFLCIGTSGLVYPAAQFVKLTSQHCLKVEFNLNETQLSPLFDEVVLGSAAATLPVFIEEFLK